MTHDARATEPTLEDIREAFGMYGAGNDYKAVYFEQMESFTTWLAERVRAAEVQALRDGAEAIERVLTNPDRRRPRIGPMQTDYANDTEWAALVLRNLADEMEKDS